MKNFGIKKLLLLNIFVQSAIIVTGAIVRITKSGLGCPTWPQCVGDSIVPLANQEESWHKFVEFGNRLLTFVLIVVAVAVVVSIWRDVELKAHRLLSTAPFFGTLAQAVLGGITVLTGLHPLTVSAHFLVSTLIVALCFKLYIDVCQGKQTGFKLSSHFALLATAFVAIVLGTVVTGSGPHSGDSFASSRYALDLTMVAQIHSKIVLVYLVLLVILWRKWSITQNAKIQNNFKLVLLVTIAQGAIGYYQFAQGVPELLVFLHVIGSVGFWLANLKLYFGLTKNQGI